MNIIKWLLIVIVVALGFVLGTAQSTAAQRPVPTPPGVALQWYHRHTPEPHRTATASASKTATVTPTATLGASATVQPSRTPIYPPLCYFVKSYTQNGVAYVEWQFSDGLPGQGHIWFGIYSANVKPTCSN